MGADQTRLPCHDSDTVKHWVCKPLSATCKAWVPAGFVEQTWLTAQGQTLGSGWAAPKLSEQAPGTGIVVIVVIIIINNKTAPPTITTITIILIIIFYLISIIKLLFPHRFSLLLLLLFLSLLIIIILQLLLQLLLLLLLFLLLYVFKFQLLTCCYPRFSLFFSWYCYCYY